MDAEKAHYKALGGRIERTNAGFGDLARMLFSLPGSLPRERTTEKSGSVSTFVNPIITRAPNERIDTLAAGRADPRVEAALHSPPPIGPVGQRAARPRLGVGASSSRALCFPARSHANRTPPMPAARNRRAWGGCSTACLPVRPGPSSPSSSLPPATFGPCRHHRRATRRPSTGCIARRA